MAQKPHNFSAGPCILPESVFEQASKAVISFGDTGLSLLEISHRSAPFVEVMDKAIALVKELLSLPEGYHPMFLSGGASTQFFMTAANFMRDGDKAAYVDTGTWSAKAIKEAQRFGTVEVVASSEDDQYRSIPTIPQLDDSYRYLHITSNNTIYGTQYADYPEVEAPLVVDCSSDIFSRPLPIERMGCIYAGAQKNMGPAGTTLVIVRDDMIAHNPDLTSMMKYKTHIDKGSMFNTPPVFPIYVSMLTLQWVKDQGGITAMEQRNQKKAACLYDYLDASSLFEGMTHKDARSKMNVTFRCPDEHVDAFNAAWQSADISGLMGHRSVGGYRASIYNAMPLSSVQHLVDVMSEFERTR